MFALRDDRTHDWARMISGQRFIYSSRSTAQIAARILAKHHKTHYVVTDAQRLAQNAMEATMTQRWWVIPW